MESTPLFSALATSTRQVYLLLRCVAFAQRAEVNITPEGLQFKVEDAHVIQGSTLIEKSLFSSYSVRFEEGEDTIPAFEINVAALLETLQIFGLAEATSTYRHLNGGISSYAAAFNNPALNISGTCQISYAEVGAPLSITIDENSVKTLCEMNTYEMGNTHGESSEIPLDRNNLTLKIIMRSSWLYDAITELSGTNPEALVLNASNTSAPYFSLEGQGGPFGDSMVDFRPEAKGSTSSIATKERRHPQVTETFAVNPPAGSHGRLRQKYRFDLIKRAGRAMQLASKVSIRQDRQGVLSLQFMIEGGDGNPRVSSTDTGGRATADSNHVSFVDFRFVPLVDESDGNSDNSEGENDSSGM